jgi:hypothetical protein
MHKAIKQEMLGGFGVFKSAPGRIEFRLKRGTTSLSPRKRDEVT